MNKELRELLDQINNKKSEAKKAYDAGNIELGNSLKDEAVALKAKFDGLVALDGLKTGEPVPDPTPAPKAMSSHEIVKAFLKGDRKSKEVVKNLQVSTDDDNVSLIIPQDIQTEIRELRRSYASMRDYIGYYPTATLSGTYPIEDPEDPEDLVDFDDGNEISQSKDPKFKPVSYTIHERFFLTYFTLIITSYIFKFC